MPLTSEEERSIKAYEKLMDGPLTLKELSQATGIGQQSLQRYLGDYRRKGEVQMIRSAYQVTVYQVTRTRARS